LRSICHQSDHPFYEPPQRTHHPQNPARELETSRNLLPRSPEPENPALCRKVGFLAAARLSKATTTYTGRGEPASILSTMQASLQSIFQRLGRSKGRDCLAVCGVSAGSVVNALFPPY